jgi:DNA repair protein RecO
MAYSVYTTEGIILAKKDFGEAERMFYIFTEEFGMIKAVARGVRYIKSKLRPNLDLFCYNNFSLIKVRDIWKITDAAEIAVIKNPEDIKFFAKIAVFLTRMIKGEEKNDFIWSELKKLFFSPEDELSFLAKVLHNLGYISEIPESKKLLVQEINKAISASML